jgi:membrane-bound ClpP family serine protease
MKTSATLVLALCTVTAAAFATPALASCRIHNETNYSFTVESGNTSNQSVGSHTTTSIAAGRVIGKSKEGKSFGGSCRDGESVKVVEQQGVVVMVPGN